MVTATIEALHTLNDGYNAAGDRMTFAQIADVIERDF